MELLLKELENTILSLQAQNAELLKALKKNRRIDLGR